MIEPFSYKKIDRWIIAASFLPLLFHSLEGLKGNVDVGPFVNWAIAGLLSWAIGSIINHQHLGLVDRNHGVAISWIVLSSVLNFSYTNFDDNNQIVALFMAGGFLSLLALALLSWQQKIAPFQYILSGVVVGVMSIFFPKAVFLLAFYPFSFYFMRSWSKPNLGCLLTGFLLTVWIGYLVRFFFVGEADADGFILSFGDIFQNFLTDNYLFSTWELVFLSVFSIYIIIYSILGVTLSVAKTVKSEACVILFSAVSVLFLLLAVFDVQNLTTYLAILSILLSFQLSIHQSYIVNPQFEWWTIIALVLFVGLDIATFLSVCNYTVFLL